MPYQSRANALLKAAYGDKPGVYHANISHTHSDSFTCKYLLTGNLELCDCEPEVEITEIK